MITSISLGSERCNLLSQAFIHRRALRRRALRLRRRVRRAVRMQRESAVVTYLCAKRFPSNSKEAVILRLIAGAAMRRRKKLETLLSYLSNTTSVQRRRWLFGWKCLCASYAPRISLLIWLKHHKD
jgi:hypothetical protein